MAKYHDGCIDGFLESHNYSAPMPAIGLYVAAASSLLLLIMLYDIMAGFRARKRWLPCKYFTLNSVILTLLSIATKLPVDLTTAMPRPVDQLSKLTATVLICVAMCFVLPSVKKDDISKWNADLVSLTIFVITVVGNICIQITTGVIMLFIYEHVIIMCVMLLLLGILWHSSCIEYFNGEIYMKLPRRSRAFAWNGWDGLFGGLKECYELCYRYNLQLAACMDVYNSTIGGLCMICSIILTQAAVRSLVLKRLDFCLGTSDYGLSTWIIVVSQMLFVLVGCFATTYRWLTMMSYCDWSASDAFRWYVEYKLKEAKIVRGRRTVNSVWKILAFISLVTLYVLQLFFEGVTRLLMIVLKQEFADVQDWRERKAREDMYRWVEAGKRTPSNHLRQLLSQTRFRPIQPLPSDIQVSDFYYDIFRKIEVLAKISKLLLPDILHAPIVGAFAEVEEAIIFIAATKFGDQEFRFLLCNLQEEWGLPDYNDHKEIPLQILGSDQYDITRAISIFKELLRCIKEKIAAGILVDLASTSLSEYVWRGPHSQDFSIRDYLSSDHEPWHSSIEDLARSMEQLFVDYLGILLVEFPEMVVKYLKEGPDEEFEKRLNIAMKFYGKLEPLKNVCPWWVKPALPGEV